MELVLVAGGVEPPWVGWMPEEEEEVEVEQEWVDDIVCLEKLMLLDVRPFGRRRVGLVREARSEGWPGLVLNSYEE